MHYIAPHDSERLHPVGVAAAGPVIEDRQIPRFAANYERQTDGSLKLLDPAQSQ